MKVGDLVKCDVNGDGFADIGIIIKENALGFYVWVNDEPFVFFRNQLDVINESR